MTDYTREQIDNLAGEIAEAHAIPPALLLRLIEVESSGDPWAVRYERNFARFHYDNNSRIHTTVETERELQRMSWGLCQIMGYTARRLSWTDPIPRLLDPVANLKVACTYLLQLHSDARAKQSWRWAITAYNHSERWEQINLEWWHEGYTNKYHAILSSLGEA